MTNFKQFHTEFNEISIFLRYMRRIFLISLKRGLLS